MEIVSTAKHYVIAIYEDNTVDIQDTITGLPCGICDTLEEAKRHFPNASEVVVPAEIKRSAYERIYADGRREIVR